MIVSDSRLLVCCVFPVFLPNGEVDVVEDPDSDFGDLVTKLGARAKPLGGTYVCSRPILLIIEPRTKNYNSFTTTSRHLPFD